MIYQKHGEGITANGTRYTIGMSILGTKESEYEGLYGTITEIRTDEDRETENDTPDIYCEFNVPVLPNEIRQMEERFTELYEQPMTLEDISLDMVIMAPEMLEPSLPPHATRPSEIIWAVIEDYTISGDPGHNETLFKHQKDACAYFHHQLACESREGCISEWDDSDAFQFENGDSFYECWLDDDYISNHFKITLEQKLIYLGGEEELK